MSNHSTSKYAEPGASTLGDEERRGGDRLSLWGAVLLLGCVACVVHNATNYDVWRNLTVGRWIVEHHRVPREEIFSFTEPGRPWTDYEWLAEVVSWIVYQAGALTGLAAFRAACVFGVMVVLLAQARQRVRGSAWCVALAGIPALVLSEFHLLVRPHLWSLLLAPLFVWWVTRPRRLRAVGVFVMFAVWANVHSGTLGLLVLGLALAGGAIRTARVKTVAAALAGLLLNPYGWRIVLPLVSILRAQTPDRLQVTEWMGLPLHEMPGFWAYLAASAALLVVPGRTMRRWDAVVIAGFGLLSLKAVRMVPFAVLSAVPGNAEALWLLLRRLPSGWSSVTCGALSVAATAAAVAPRLPITSAPDPRTVPDAAASYVASHHLDLRCYNDMQHGAYLMWRWYPRLPIYMDNRTELFADLAAMERAASQDLTSFIAFLESHGIKGAVLDYPWKIGNTETTTFYPLFKFLGWQTVAWDDGGVLLLAPRAGRDSLIAADAYAALDPFIIDPPHLVLASDERQTQLAEARRACSSTPASSRAWQIWGNISSSANRPATALAAYEKVVALNPKDPDIHARMALALEKLERYEDATREWRRQASRRLDLPQIWFNLGRLAMVRARPQEARSWLAKAIKADPGNGAAKSLRSFALNATEGQLRQQQGALRADAAAKEQNALAAMSRGEWEHAETILRQATAAVPSKASFHQNLGACLANQGLFEEAEAELREALLLDEGLGWARYNLAGLLATSRADTQGAITELMRLKTSRHDSALAALAEGYLKELTSP